MKWFSFLIAAIVAAIVYMFIMEREAVFRFAGVTDGPAAQETEAIEDMASAVAEDATKRVSVVVESSVAHEIDSAVVLRGRTEAARQVTVKAETSGPITSAPLRKGTMVETGQLLCAIDTGTREASLAEARAKLASAKAGLPVSEARVREAEALLDEAEINNRASAKLIERGFASETKLASTRAGVSSALANVESARSGLESARSAVEAAEAAVALAQKELDRITMEAPFAGILETDTAELGALMQPGSVCATVIQLDPMKLVGFVPETQVEKVRLGARAGARLVSGRELLGEVTFLARSADPLTRTFRVEVEVPNRDLSIRDGQTVEIAIEAAGQMAHLLPGSSLTLDDHGALGVRVAVPGDDGPVAAFRPVQFLRDTPDGVYVAGLPATADVIVVGQEYVTEGVPIDLTFRGTELGQ
ncbi:efflux RND transporter periplasmic adaptor subunit [Tropicimonas sp. IMCC6043]|uniref:efflux RND transporter periplasmic adaptor subunit n=1 Tax=Tropicimonas sp. IMCC6043 TaxID=2510645 RepID=UPI00101D03AD|nr:efflux RND transporter periplasmic adaptor subunit [Tropicimonas sp. IMCC6043]RYH10388.1 efflux RND transporter periplasmic adaptor subunit [Tropicimonas sp. IMCC6043]